MNSADAFCRPLTASFITAGARQVADAEAASALTQGTIEEVRATGMRRDDALDAGLNRYQQQLDSLASAISQCNLQLRDAYERIESMDGSIKALTIATKTESPLHWTALLEDAESRLQTLAQAMSTDEAAAKHPRCAALQVGCPRTPCAGTTLHASGRRYLPR